MRKKKPRESMPEELQLAIGLVWGHLNAYQHEQAYLLALGCLKVWPHETRLQLMAAYAAAEVLEPVDREQLLALRNAQNDAWIKLVLRRLDIHQDAASAGLPTA
ncbi:hypothetical protein PMI16_02135 [Herbaspirillum sp. CF444]|uniref:hypothetical protein n=1 Tax=Herbaspirillum sp. CF444 TaxID=1144319 RepID=UPI00027268CA|nr:hypothetical protein [Herbaspirillum sp. CF444]EJL88987.1 hypothetical protein PMI16_02135 [Herbaspirillum sp. CF444]